MITSILGIFNPNGSLFYASSRSNWPPLSAEKISLSLSHLVPEIIGTQLPHSYYFITRILVLIKGYLLRKSRIRIFLEKEGIFSTDLCKFGEKGVNCDNQCFTYSLVIGKLASSPWRVCFTLKRGVHLGWKVSILLQKKGVHFELKSQCFTVKNGWFWGLGPKVGLIFHQNVLFNSF